MKRRLAPATHKFWFLEVVLLAVLGHGRGLDHTLAWTLALLLPCGPRQGCGPVFFSTKRGQHHLPPGLSGGSPEITCSCAVVAERGEAVFPTRLRRPALSAWGWRVATWGQLTSSLLLDKMTCLSPSTPFPPTGHGLQRLSLARSPVELCTLLCQPLRGLPALGVSEATVWDK